ncbi:MAG: hypothetical protein Fur005_39090 [Roseiflexaceae bacterium]
MMINLNPDTAKQDATVMKAVVRLNQNNAGVYGTVVREGAIAVGQRVSLLINRSNSNYPISSHRSLSGS